MVLGPWDGPGPYGDGAKAKEPGPCGREHVGRDHGAGNMVAGPWCWGRGAGTMAQLHGPDQGHFNKRRGEDSTGCNERLPRGDISNPNGLLPAQAFLSKGSCRTSGLRTAGLSNGPRDLSTTPTVVSRIPSRIQRASIHRNGTPMQGQARRRTGKRVKRPELSQLATQRRCQSLLQVRGYR